jgi:hypothetical protein
MMEYSMTLDQRQKQSISSKVELQGHFILGTLTDKGLGSFHSETG